MRVKNAYSSRRDALVSRRDSIRFLAAISAGAFFPLKQTFAAERTSASRIDLHHHYVSNEILREVIEKQPNPQPMRDYTPERSLEAMDRAGIATAFLSCPLEGMSVRTTRPMNEYGARLRSDHPGRFGVFAALPLPDVDASLREIEFVFDTLKADGIAVISSYEGHWLGDPSLQPVFDELNRRRAVVYTHPTVAPCCRDIMPGIRADTVEFNTDTSRAIWSLLNDIDLATGRPKPSMATRYGNVTFIWSHAGGSLLGLVGRFLGAAASTENLAKVPEKDSRIYHLRRFYFDTAASANPIQTQALKSLVGTSQIVFGTDYPFAPIINAANGLQDCGFSADELRAIERDNALRLLKRT
jgi:predicted TIM-barrel fold metal-dependent hydrolase